MSLPALVVAHPAIVAAGAASVSAAATAASDSPDAIIIGGLVTIIVALIGLVGTMLSRGRKTEPSPPGPTPETVLDLDRRVTVVEEIIHDVRTDMRESTRELREIVGLLREQVARLEGQQR